MTAWILSILCVSSAVAQEVQLTKEDIDAAYQRWQETIRKKRSVHPSPQTREQRPEIALDPQKRLLRQASASQPQGENYIIVGGEKVFLRSQAEAIPSPPPESGTKELSVASATDEVKSETAPENAGPVKTEVPPPTPTPAPVAIKVARIVGGKIVEVEVLVTPTPNPEKVKSATASAPVQVDPVTGELRIIRDQLRKAAKSSKPVHFSHGMINKILKEFMKARATNKKLNQVLPPKNAVILQSRLQRLASQAQGGDLPAAPAKILLKVLFPPKPEPKKPPAPSPEKSTTPHPAAESAEATAEEDVVPEEELPDDQIYIDPDTGEYVYADGSPAPAPTPVPPPPQDYVPPDENPPPPPQYEPGYEVPPPPPPPENEYYEDTGDVYYEDEGNYVENDPYYYDDQGNVVGDDQGYYEDQGDDYYYEDQGSDQGEEYYYEDDGTYYEDDGGYYQEDF